MKPLPSANTIPLAIKIFAGIIALIGLMFSFSGYFYPAQLSPGASWDHPSTLLARHHWLDEPGVERWHAAGDLH